jgi:exosortase family protein XrtG
MNWLFSALLFTIWLGAVSFFRAYRIWILYYLTAVSGFAYLLVLATSSMFQLEITLAHTVASGVHFLLNLAGIPSQIFSNAPGILLVMVITQRTGWTALQIGVESSGLLEMSVLTSLVLFYPEWRISSRLRLILTGNGLTWVANILRMFLIAVMLHFLGKDALLIAHSLVGRIFFFLFTIGIYWFLITARSLRTIEERLATGEWTTAP